MIFSRPIPARVGGLKLWLDASSLSSLYTDSARTTPVAANDDPAGGWSDLSGNNNHALQATASKRPLFKTSGINGHPAILFDGVDDCLDLVSNPLNGLTAYTLFIVGKYDAAAGYLHDFSGGTDHAVYCNGSAIKNWNTTTLTASALTTAFLYAKKYAQSDTPDESFRWNRSDVAGTSSYSAAGAGGARFGAYVGNSWYANVRIGEVIIYNRALTSDEISAIENYLHSKWGVG